MLVLHFGFWYNFSLILTTACSPKCLTCTDLNTCVTCSTSRIGPPVCSCPSGYLELSTSACTPCDFSCASCDTATSTCKCPPVATTFRKQSADYLTCPCLPGYFDPQASTKICQKCFSKYCVYFKKKRGGGGKVEYFLFFFLIFFSFILLVVRLVQGVQRLTA